MRHAVLATCLLLAVPAAQAALVTYDFTALRTSIDPDIESVSGMVDALRSRETIRGSITFDTTLRGELSRNEGQIYEKPSIAIDGVDTASANSRALTSYVERRAFDDVIGTSYRGSVRPGPAEAYDVFIFTGIDRSKSLVDSDAAFPGSLPAISTLTRYTVSFWSVTFDGNAFGPQEIAYYALTSLTARGSGAVPLPASSLLALGGLAALAATRRIRPRAAAAPVA
jgi:hypothetical protein